MNTMQNVNKNQDPHNGKENKNLVFCLELFFNTFLFFLSPRIHLDFDTNFALRFKQSSTSKCIFIKKIVIISTTFWNGYHLEIGISGYVLVKASSYQNDFNFTSINLVVDIILILTYMWKSRASIICFDEFDLGFML